VYYTPHNLARIKGLRACRAIRATSLHCVRSQTHPKISDRVQPLTAATDPNAIIITTKVLEKGTGTHCTHASYHLYGLQPNTIHFHATADCMRRFSSPLPWHWVCLTAYARPGLLEGAGGRVGGCMYCSRRGTMKLVNRF
jgi:hypothetical protein